MAGTFYTYLVAADIKDETQKHAILLYQAGPEVYEIFKTLPNTGAAKDFKKAVDALTAYFEPDKNKIYQTYMFRQAKQMPSETVDQYHTRLRGLAKYCDFHDTDFEIKMQIVCSGTSSRLRKRALRDADYSLKDMLVDSRKAEISTAQASGIEEQFKELQVNETKTSSRKCYYCGLGYPQNDRPCPTKSSTCASCGVKGHFAKVCRSSQKHDKQKQQKKNQKFTRKVRPKTDKSKPYRHNGQARAITVKSEVSDSDTGSTGSDYVYAVQKQENATHGVKKTTLKINNKQFQLLVDTGATVDLVDSKTYELLRNQVTLDKSNTKIYAYRATKPLPLTGQFQAAIESKIQYTVSQFYVVEGRRYRG